MLRYYFDEHMPHAVERGLIARGIEVLMAINLDMEGKDDDTEHLALATEKEAVTVTRDFPFAGRTAKRDDHAGLLCWTGAQNDFGGMIHALAEFAEKHSPEDVKGQVFWIK